MMKRILPLAACLAAGLLFAGGALAQDSANQGNSDKGDLQAGKYLVYTCHGCHGIHGYENAYPNYRVPRIAGQNYDYLVKALHEYRSGKRHYPTMNAQGEALSDQEIKDIAAYLSSIKPNQ